MIPFLQQLRLSVDAIYPGLFNAGLAAVLFAALWVIRRFKPLLFANMPAALQAWPALASGAVIAALSASTDGNIGGAVVNALGQALAGLVSGVLAVGLHRTLKESPLPYGNGQIPPKSGAGGGPAAVGIVFLVALASLLALPSCTPSELQQAATIADDVTKVAQVLCLAEHAKHANARALSVADACSTVEQLAPYVEQAKNAAPRAACAKLEPSDAGAP